MPDTPGVPLPIPPSVVTSPTGSEVAPNPPVVPVAGAGVAPLGDPIVTALEAASAGITTLQSSLGTTYTAPSDGTSLRIAHPWQDVIAAIVAAVQLCKARPAFAGTADLVTMASVAARVPAGMALETALESLLTDVKVANRATLDTGWQGTLIVYHSANRTAATDHTVATAIEPIQVLFQKAPRDVQSAATAATLGVQAIKAGNRATTSTTRASTARARATALAPKSLSSGPGDATITQPAPAPATPATR